jgi:hypothetical protein
MEKAILNVKEKTLTFNFKKEFFALDVSDIDEDHWDTITCKDNIQYDINFWFCDLDNCWKLGIYNLKTIKGTVEVDTLVCSYIVEPIEYKDSFLCESLSSSKKVNFEDKHNILLEKNKIVLNGLFAWLIYINTAIWAFSFLIKFLIFIVTLLK